jgi:hypothetical protein
MLEEDIAAYDGRDLSPLFSACHPACGSVKGELSVVHMYHGSGVAATGPSFLHRLGGLLHPIFYRLQRLWKALFTNEPLITATELRPETARSAPVQSPQAPMMPSMRTPSTQAASVSSLRQKNAGRFAEWRTHATVVNRPRQIPQETIQRRARKRVLAEAVQHHSSEDALALLFPQSPAPIELSAYSSPSFSKNQSPQQRASAAESSARLRSRFIRSQSITTTTTTTVMALESNTSSGNDVHTTLPTQQTAYVPAPAARTLPVTAMATLPVVVAPDILEGEACPPTQVPPLLPANATKASAPMLTRHIRDTILALNEAIQESTDHTVAAVPVSSQDVAAGSSATQHNADYLSEVGLDSDIDTLQHLVRRNRFLSNSINHLASQYFQSSK